MGSGSAENSENVEKGDQKVDVLILGGGLAGKLLMFGCSYKYFLTKFFLYYSQVWVQRFKSKIPNSTAIENVLI